ncbi:hypothetical protein ACNQKP_10605 [Bdellovibrio bacteriovorus]|uniref:hypothetical protein n=1 Tax=Bdellovibrio bacteriovorus TaxID=959 RepID=UPI003AA91907
MFKKVAAGVLTFFCFSTVLADDLKDLEISGFRAIKSNSSMMKLQYGDEKPFVISKVKFSSEEHAKSFCKKNKLKLDVNGFDKVLLLAMSGAANLNNEIMEAITFKLNEESSGIAAWTGSNSQVMIMWDGRGSASETAKIEDIAKAAQKLGAPNAATFSAVCE